MSPRKRVIPVVLTRGRRQVKTSRFSDPLYVGDPLNSVLIHSENHADEVIVLDIRASQNSTGPDFELAERLAYLCRAPLTVGGGVSTYEQAARLISLGVEKISFNTALIQAKREVAKVANAFGSQATVASIDVRIKDGSPRVWLNSSRSFLEGAVETHMSELCDLGAGEILLTDVDREGTMMGPNLELACSLAESTPLPVIFNGGVALGQDVRRLLETSISAVAVGAATVFQKRAGAGIVVGLPDDLNSAAAGWPRNETTASHQAPAG